MALRLVRGRSAADHENDNRGEEMMMRFITPQPRPTTPGVSRWRTVSFSIIASAVGVALGVSGAGATFAFLNVSTPVAEATVKAGTFGIRIGDGTSTALPAKKLSPAVPATWAFTVTNIGDAPADLAAQITAPGGPAYAASARGSLTEVADATACTSALAGTTPLNGYTEPALGALAPNESRIYCLVAGLPNPAPAVGSGAPLAFTLTIDAVQKGA